MKSKGIPKAELDSAIHELALSLGKCRARLVLAESCTGGLLAARLTEIPGISEFFCGSHVVYRESSKSEWLGVKNTLLKKVSAVSADVAEAMVRGALEKTPEASIAGAITGYLGPTGKSVGKVFVSAIRRGDPTAVTFELDLRLGEDKKRSPLALRLHRRDLAGTALVLLLSSLLGPDSTLRAGKPGRRM